MNGFSSFSKQFERLLTLVVSDDGLHVRWLNALSFLENCGARKIAGCEHPTNVGKEMLKHAAEEFRHAYTLKQQLIKIDAEQPDTYHVSSLLGGMATLHYLHRLDLEVSRYLKQELQMEPTHRRQIGYLLVTYAIERRAAELYPLYQDFLKKVNSRITVKAILAEEEEHLADMEKELSTIECAQEYIERVCHMESMLCKNWLQKVEQEVFQG